MSIERVDLKRRIPIVIAVIACLLLVVEPAPSRAFAEPLRLGVFPNLHSALIYLADSQGFFKKHGVDVAVKVYESGPAAINDLIADKIDISTPAEFVFVLQSFQHPDLRIAATICVASDHDLIVRKDRGITLPRDLRGQRVAVTRGSSGEFFLYNYLIVNNVPARDIRVVDLVPSQMVEAMTNGTVDAALCWPPYAGQIEKQLGAKVARWPAQSGQEYYMVLLAREGFLKKRPKTIESFLAALLDAETFVARYPDRAQAIVRQRLKADPGPFLEAWSGSRFQLQLTQDLLVLMEREATWAIRNKLVQEREPPNYLDFFSFEALEKVKPEAVSIIHE